MEHPFDPKILSRLRSIEGHVRGIAKMVEEDAYCIDVVHQIQACVAEAYHIDFTTRRPRELGHQTQLVSNGSTRREQYRQDGHPERCDPGSTVTRPF